MLAGFSGAMFEDAQTLETISGCIWQGYELLAVSWSVDTHINTHILSLTNFQKRNATMAVSACNERGASLFSSSAQKPHFRWSIKLFRALIGRLFLLKASSLTSTFGDYKWWNFTYTRILICLQYVHRLQGWDVNLTSIQYNTNRKPLNIEKVIISLQFINYQATWTNWLELSKREIDIERKVEFDYEWSCQI